MQIRAYLRTIIATSLSALFCTGSSDLDNIAAAIPPAQSTKAVPDFSGLAWVEADSFLAVHDAKNPEEKERDRVSLLSLPRSLDGISLKPFAIDWPSPLGASSDLESIARIPGTNTFLLVESGETRDNRQQFRRVFLIELRGGQLNFLSFTELPSVIKNIEGSAVWKMGTRLLFVCAERGDHRESTEFYWADLQLEPLRLGAFQKAYFKPTGFTGKNKRPVSAIEVDSRGRIFIASAYDPEDDNGPFTSVIWLAGRFETSHNKSVKPVFSAKPLRLATLDGMKVESLAVREAKPGVIELFAGTDDENYGGAIRPIPINP